MFDPNFAAYNTISVGVTATLISAGAQRRSSILVQNVHGTNKVYVGPDASITTANTIRLSPDDSVEFSEVQGDIYAIADGAATDVRFLEFG